MYSLQPHKEFFKNLELEKYLNVCRFFFDFFFELCLTLCFVTDSTDDEDEHTNYDEPSPPIPGKIHLNFAFVFTKN